ncbi:MAG: hypothetical protein WAW39_01575, partial [Prosthecobacter sp.]
PQPGDEGMERYLCSLTGRSYIPGEASKRATRTNSTEPQPVSEGSDASTQFPSNTQNTINLNPAGIKRNSVETQSSTIALESSKLPIEDVTSRKKERSLRFKRLAMADQLQTEDSLFEALQLIRPALDDNPRKLKLALNLLRLHGFLASDWIANPPPPGATGPRITLVKLAKFIAMDIRWPTYLLSLADLVSNMNIDANQPAYAPLLNRHPELVALMNRGGDDEILRVADLRAILSVAPSPNAVDSEMMELAAAADSSGKSSLISSAVHVMRLLIERSLPRL